VFSLRPLRGEPSLEERGENAANFALLRGQGARRMPGGRAELLVNGWLPRF
jgi:hypothetical protein